MNAYLGEIVEARTTTFIAYCPTERLHAPPHFGAIVRVTPDAPTPPREPQPGTPPAGIDPFAEPDLNPPPPPAPEGTLYAVVIEATTGSLEPGRRPAAFGLAEEQLREEQPQIFQLLTTAFHALHVGYVHNGHIRLQMPPRPPRVHAFVTECTPAEIHTLTREPDFWRILLNAPANIQPDELIAAVIHHTHTGAEHHREHLIHIGKQLALLLQDTPERLTALLRRIQQQIPSQEKTR